MKTMKKWLLLLTAFAMLFSLAACGGASDDLAEAVEQEAKEPAMTADTLLENISDAMAGRELTAAFAEVAMDADITAEGETVNMTMDMALDMICSTNPYAAYMDMDYNISMMGESMEESMEMYMAVEDGMVMTYAYVESYDTWSVTEVGAYDDVVTGAESDYSWLTEKDAAEVTLAEETQTVDGREVYVLDLTITGEQMNEVVGAMEDSLAEAGMGSMDMTGMDVPVTLMVDAESFMITQMDVDMMSMEDLMNDMIGSMSGTDTSGTEIVFNEFTYVYSGMRYDSVEVPAVPDEAKQSTVVDDATLELPVTEEETTTEGVYTIEESGHAVDITCPDGWYVAETTYDSLMLVQNDDMVYAYYLMFDEYSKEDFLVMLEFELIQPYQEDGTYVSETAGPQICGMDTRCVVTSEGYNLYLAYGEMDGGWLYLEVADANFQGLESTLTPLLEAVAADADAV